MFERTFQTELDYLYQLCEELGRTHPRVAPVLGRDADPGVSRLVQSLAFSFARLRDRLDDELPEVIHPVIDSLCPALLRPFPSATMFELEATRKGRTRQTIEKGRRFESPPVEGVRCAFSTTEEITLQPMILRRAELRGERRQMLFEFELFEGVKLTEIDWLSFYFAADLPHALDLRAHWFRHTEKVVARASGREVSLDASADLFRRPGFADRHLPGSNRVGDPLLLAREYFAFTNKFARLDVRAPDLSALGSNDRTFEVDVHLREPIPPHIPFDPSSVRLHAVPAVQVGAPQFLTIRTEPEDDRWSLRELVGIDDVDIYSVERVAVVERGTLKSKPVPGWSDLIPPPLENTEDGTLFYELSRRRSAVGPEIEIELTFGTTARAQPPGGDVEVTLVTTHLRRAAKLEIGSITDGGNENAVVSYRNVTPVTRCAPAVLEGDRLWHFYRYFKLGLPQLAERNELAHLLARANLPAWGRWPGAKESATDFEALLDVRWRRTHLTSQAVARIGVELDVFIDESRFSGLGDIHLFGEVMEVLLAGSASEDDTIRLTLLGRNGDKLFSYDYRSGTRAP